MYGFRADAGMPKQSLFDLRRETASELRRRGWVAEVKGNSGRYELVR
jgi:hypothetical protein